MEKDQRPDEQKARDGVRRILLDLLTNDDDVKQAVASVFEEFKFTAPNGGRVDEAHFVTLIEEHVKKADAPGVDTIKKAVRSMFRQYLRPDAINGNYATALFREQD